LPRQKIADQLGLAVANVYRILKNQTMPEKKREASLKKNVVKPKRGERKPKAVPDTGQLSMFNPEVPFLDKSLNFSANGTAWLFKFAL
jgi:hypothetical protein